MPLNLTSSYYQCEEDLIITFIFQILQIARLSEVIDYVCQNGYFMYADTFINSIFVDKEAWSQRS